MAKTSIEWTEEDKGWLQGIIDGEGNLSLITENRIKFTHKFAFKPMISVSNTNLKIISEVSRLTNHKFHKRKTTVLNHLDIYYVALYSNDLRRILPKIKLIGKEKQRLLLLEALEILKKPVGKNNSRSKIDGDRLLSITKQIRKLNKRWYGVDLGRQRIGKK